MQVVIKKDKKLPKTHSRLFIFCKKNAAAFLIDMQVVIKKDYQNQTANKGHGVGLDRNMNSFGS